MLLLAQCDHALHIGDSDVVSFARCAGIAWCDKQAFAMRRECNFAGNGVFATAATNNEHRDVVRHASTWSNTSLLWRLVIWIGYAPVKHALQ